jgi:hypothetical protein
MKLSIIFTMLFLFCLNVCVAQRIPSSEDSTLERKVKEASLIVEGEVIGTTCSDKAYIVTFARIKISKVFKGSTLDSIIEIALNGGYCNGYASIISNGLMLGKGREGVFLLVPNNTGNTADKSLASYVVQDGRYGYIGYHHKPEMVANYVATCINITYEDLETELFQRIEKATGQERKVVGQNSFEKEAANKK